MQRQLLNWYIAMLFIVEIVAPVANGKEPAIQMLALTPEVFYLSNAYCRESIRNVIGGVSDVPDDIVPGQRLEVRYVKETYDTAALVKDVVSLDSFSATVTAEWAGVMTGPYILKHCDIAPRLVKHVLSLPSISSWCSSKRDRIERMAFSLIAFSQKISPLLRKFAVINYLPESREDYMLGDVLSKAVGGTDLQVVFSRDVLSFDDDLMTSLKQSEARLYVLTGMDVVRMISFLCMANQQGVSPSEFLFIATGEQLTSSLEQTAISEVTSSCGSWSSLLEQSFFMSENLAIGRICQQDMSRATSTVTSNFSIGATSKQRLSLFLGSPALSGTDLSISVHFEARQVPSANGTSIQFEVLNLSQKAADKLSLLRAAMEVTPSKDSKYSTMFAVFLSLSVTVTFVQLVLSLTAIIVRRSTSEFARRSPRSKVFCLFICLLLNVASFSFSTDDTSVSFCVVRAVMCIFGLGLLHGYFLFRLLLANRRNNRGVAVHFNRTTEQQQTVKDFVALMRDGSIKSVDSNASKILKSSLKEVKEESPSPPPPVVHEPTKDQKYDRHWRNNSPSTVHEQDRIVFFGSSLVAICTVPLFLCWFFIANQPTDRLFHQETSVHVTNPRLCLVISKPSYWLDLIVLYLLLILSVSFIMACYVWQNAKANRLPDMRQTCIAVFSQVTICLVTCIILLSEMNLLATKVTMAIAMLASSVSATVFILIGKWNIWRNAMKRHAVFSKLFKKSSNTNTNNNGHPPISRKQSLVTT